MSQQFPRRKKSIIEGWALMALILKILGDFAIIRIEAAVGVLAVV